MAQNNLLWIILWLGRWPSFGKPACIALNDFLATKIIESYQAQINPIWMKTWDKKKWMLFDWSNWMTHCFYNQNESIICKMNEHCVITGRKKKCNSYILANTIYIYCTGMKSAILDIQLSPYPLVNLTFVRSNYHSCSYFWTNWYFYSYMTNTY